MSELRFTSSLIVKIYAVLKHRPLQAGVYMNIKKIKTKCTKQSTSKCEGICKTYTAIAEAFVNVLEADDDIVSFTTNVEMKGLDIGEYTTDFYCTNSSGEHLVRECIDRDYISRPKTAKLLDYSRKYWFKNGVNNWGLVTNGKKDI